MFFETAKVLVNEDNELVTTDMEGTVLERVPFASAEEAKAAWDEKFRHLDRERDDLRIEVKQEGVITVMGPYTVGA